MKKKIKNPLIKRIPKELRDEWKKYLVVFFFLVLTIGFVSGMYVANESMMTSAEKNKEQCKLEDGHFELDKKADQTLLDAIAAGEKADVKQYYLDEAKKKLDEKFTDEFKSKFDKSFTKTFDEQFATQVEAQLAQAGMDEQMIAAMLPDAVEQAKQNGTYQSAYDAAYDSAYQDAYDTAYDKAWKKAEDKLDKEYADAAEKYELNDPDFTPSKAAVYENFWRTESEDYNNDGKSEGTIRLYAKNDDINLACILDGRFPENENEIAVDRMHADNVGIKTGDTITVGDKKFKVVGQIAYVNYATLHEKPTDLMFDALKFDVAMVTQEGFDRLTANVHYTYAWKYQDAPADEAEEKTKSDNFMRALLTQAITADAELEDYVPAYANPAINFATDDMGSDEAMGGVLLDILIVIIAFIFAITISNTITKEASAIGTLRASGYTRGELVRHYLSMPVIVTILAACVGNILGYTVFKNVVVGMYYNSYSLPAYETIWNPDAFVKTTIIPFILMFVVNLIVIVRMMQHTPLQFLRHDLKKTKRKKTIRLPKWSFFARFRLRIMIQNSVNYLVLFVGIFFIMVMLAMAVGMPDTLKYYQNNISDLMFAKYQYVLTSYKDEDGELITTDNPDAEKFDMTSLQKKSDELDEEVSIYGIQTDSRYVKIPKLSGQKGLEAALSASFCDKYGLSVGDTVTLSEKYENKQYEFQITGIYDQCQSIAVFLSIDQYQEIFDLKEDEFSGYLSDTKLTDLDEDNIATVLTERDFTKMADQLDHSMGSYMSYFQILCILLSAVMIYLLTKLIIEKNENAISMTKILGYENGEIARLYLMSTTIVLLVADALSVGLGTLVMDQAWRIMLKSYSGWFAFRMEPAGYVKMFVFVLIGYLIVMVFDFQRIKKIPMDQALKNVE